jgi:hypothetical protein
VNPPECCTKYKDHCFIFGSNLAGKHGKGAALHAREHHGAVYGQCIGPMGRSYAIPTKMTNLQPLSLESIAEYVADFLHYANDHLAPKFYVTRVGCGLAGYTDSEIAPMFADAPPNCVLPEGWRVSPSPEGGS